MANKRLGLEKLHGIGGGIVKEKSRIALEKGEDLARKRRPNEALPYIQEALNEDPNNLDAYIAGSFLQHVPAALELLADGEKRGKIILKLQFGPKCFDDDSPIVGQYWSTLETRPYMRLLQAQVRMYCEGKMWNKCSNVIIEMLRLNPGDNQGQRNWLGSSLLLENRNSEALFLAQQYIESSQTGVVLPRGGTLFQPPSKQLMPEAKAKDWCRWGAGWTIYTAALASFRVWGDCPESRQYLRMAAEASQHIMTRILGKVSRPENLNNSPRSINGPEDANDYMWLSHPLWMDETIWNWVNGDEIVRKIVLKNCSREGCEAVEARVVQFKRCSACHQVVYCTAECQKQDWGNHKTACKEHKLLKQQKRMFMQGRTVKDPVMPMFASDFDGKKYVTIDKNGVADT